MSDTEDTAQVEVEETVVEDELVEDGEELPSDRVADLVEYLVTSLVDNVDAVTIDVIDSPESSLIELHVSPEDVGRVIGRRGRVIKSIRSLARACGNKLGVNIDVEIVE